MKKLLIYLFIAAGLFSCKKEKEKPQVHEQVSELRFTYVPSSKSGVTFQNTLSNSEYFNVIEYPKFYQGAGVAIGDINNDGLPDLYFVSNQWENKLYLNKGDFKFEDITAKAGVAGVGNWKVAVWLNDENNDGWLDIYVEEEGVHYRNYHELFINNHDLTFTKVQPDAGPIALLFDVDNDVADVNGDGADDMIMVGNFPDEDRIAKTTLLRMPDDIAQYATFPFSNHVSIEEGEGYFTNVAWFAGVGATDWSWGALNADFDNDGLRDMFITRGILGRINDLDYLTTTDTTLPADQRYNKMPSGALSNLFLKQKRSLKYVDVSDQWIGTKPGLSNGSAYGDLDNDGDLDLVVNNMNAEAYILRNDLVHTDSTNYLRIAFDSLNLGTSVMGYADGKIFLGRQIGRRGYVSASEPVIHFGLGPLKGIDSLIVVMRDGRYQKLKNIEVNQTLTLKTADASGQWKDIVPTPLIDSIESIRFKHLENKFNTLDKQPLIPFTNATRGPKMSVADINRDKLEDVYINGGQGQPGAIYIQTKAGKFVQIPQPAFEGDKHCEETCSAFLDVDGDRDLDLMVGSGGEEFLDKRISLRLYVNNGRGTFMKAEGLKRADIVSNLQKIYVNASCIVPADIDNDKDIDVFVGGGAVTGRYGVDSDSFILLNDGKGMLTESPVSFENRQRPGGIVQAAGWTDINGDEFPDLVTAGEWMTVSVWMNDQGVLKRQTGNGLDSTFGWWSSMAVEDMDGDGDQDIVAGNFGLNTRLQVSKNEPVELILSDLDYNGKHDPLLTYYNKSKRYPLPSRDALVAQAPALAKKYPTYASYADATAEQLITGKRILERRINTLASAYFENQGNGKFIERSLPDQVQYFPVLAIETDDVNGDGKMDILLAGNLNGVNHEIGTNKEGHGLVLTGKGNGRFEALNPLQSGFIIKGEGRDIQSLINFKKEKLYLVTRNNDSLAVFKKREIK